MTHDEQQQVNRRIAELCGWKELQPDSWWIENAYDTYKQHGTSGINRNGARYPIPDYCTSLDAVAAELPMSDEIRFEYDRELSLPVVCWIKDEWRGEGATRAEAAARALLAYLESEAQGGANQCRSN